MILLDTHAFVWLVSDPDQLSKAAWQCIREEPDDIAVSLVTSWEIFLLHKRGRLELPLDPGTFLQRAIKHFGIYEIPLSRAVILHAVHLPDLHNDPFDRILIAEAMRGNARIVTKDRIIAKYPNVITVW